MIEQLDKINEIDNIGNSMWVEVLKMKPSKNFLGEDVYKIGVLLNKEKKVNELKNQDFGHLINLVPYCDSEGNYYKDGNKDLERIVGYRFNEITEEYELSIVEEFIYFHNLHCKDDNYYKIDESYNKEKVVCIEKDRILIRKKELKQYLGIKDKVLVICFEYRYYSEQNTSKKKNKIIQIDNTVYSYYVGNMNSTVSYKSIGIIMGKKILDGIAKEKTGLWEYKKVSETYCEYKLGYNEEGEEMYHTCNPSKLGNFYFNNIKPDYLTPIYFTKDVLSKYYSNDKFEVNDNHIRGNGWLLKMDNQRDDLVSVYLGDLAILPYNEQLYWKTFNIISEQGVSKTSFERDFEAKWSNPEALDLLFKQKYKIINDMWKEKFKWELFKELHEEDKHNFNDLRIPVNESQAEFDSQVLSLVKVLIDSINEKEIDNYLKSKEIEGIKGSINKFEYFMKSITPNKDEEIMSIIGGLKQIQSLRSTGTGHRKSKNYEKSKKKLEIENKNYIESFKRLLELSLEFLEFLEKSIL